MRALCIVLAILFMLGGFMTVASGPTAMQQSVGCLILLGGVVFFCTSAVLFSLSKTRDLIEARLPKRETQSANPS